MKSKTLSLIIAQIFFIAQMAYGAISANTIFYVRTDGAETNGGGFVKGASGTNYAQQAAAQITRTDLVIGNPATTTLTSAATPFTTAEIGNIIHVTAGTNFTDGHYEITAVDGSNIATVDRAVGTAGATGGTGVVGGAKAHPDDVDDTTVLTAGNIVYIKSGTYSGQIWTPNAGSDGGNGTPIRWIGWDGSDTNTDVITDSRPVISGSGITNCLSNTGNNQNIFRNLIFRGASGIGVIADNTAQRQLYVNCRSTVNGSHGFSTAQNSIHIGCESDGNTAKGFNFSNQRSSRVLWCYAHDNSTAGIDGGNSGFEDLIGCIADTNAADGIVGGNAAAGDGAYMILNNVSYNNTNDGFEINVSSNGNIDQQIMLNNISQDNSVGYNFSGGTDITAFFDFNQWNGNTTELSNISEILQGNNNVRDSNSLMSNPGANAFNLQASSPCLEAGLDADNYSDSDLFGSSNWSIGASQNDQATGGTSSGASFFFMR